MAGIAENDARTMEAFARQGLRSNPRHPLLINNLVVALADQGKLNDAQAEFDKIPKSNVRGEVDAAILATQGLLRFRAGDLAEGRRLYHAAAATAADAGWRSVYALAFVHLTREEQRINSPLAGPTLELAVRACQGLHAPEIHVMLRRLGGA